MSDSPWELLPTASNHADSLDGLYLFLTFIAGISFVLVIGAMFYFMVKYKKRSDNDKTSPLTHNGRLEFGWSAVPAVFLMVFFIWGERDFVRLSAPPADALDIRITGQKWYWTIEYPGRPVASTTTVEDGEIAPLLIVPKDVPVRLIMTSKDVLHSFYIPAFRVKKDVVPGRYSAVWFTAIEEGTFPVFCTEYCGD
ncbi:MAG: cytochrome c oxidase subunit II, partial [Myxococcales bacterium]|nr:cytochrome c oxidase subunit II [Myxococcales bacterium]